MNRISLTSVTSISMGLLTMGFLYVPIYSVSIPIISLPILWIAWCIWRGEKRQLILTGAVAISAGFLWVLGMIFLIVLLIMFLE